MKVKDLFESDNPEYQIEIDQLTDYIRTNCPNNFKKVMTGKAPLLFRGDNHPAVARITDNHEHFFFFKSRERITPRKSLTDNSFVNSYLSYSEDWINYPNRQYSTFCTTNAHEARGFGNKVYMIIPFDSVSDFACISQDWNDKMINRKFELSDFGGQIADLCTTLNDINEVLNSSNDMLKIFDALPRNVKVALSNPSLKEDLSHNKSKVQMRRLLSALSIAYKFFADYKLDNIDAEHSILISSYRRTYKNVFDGEDAETFLKQQLTPEKMGVELYHSLNNLKPHNTDSPEIWFSGQYIAIASTSVDDTESCVDSKFLNDLLNKI